MSYDSYFYMNIFKIIIYRDPDFFAVLFTIAYCTANKSSSKSFQTIWQYNLWTWHLTCNTMTLQTPRTIWSVSRWPPETVVTSHRSCVLTNQLSHDKWTSRVCLNLVRSARLQGSPLIRLKYGYKISLDTSNLILVIGVICT